MSFDVMRDPWIPCVDPGGKTAPYGIRELLLNAHSLSEVRVVSPLQEYGIYRLLTVVAMDMLRPKDAESMGELLAAGRFDKEQVDAYIALCEKDGPCFDLFDKNKPFMQDAFDPRYDGDKCVKPVSILLHDLPGGNNHIHFDHRLADTHRFSYAECAGALCAVNVFCTAGLQGPSSINGAPPYYALIKGRRLYESLILNCIPDYAKPTARYAQPGPAWRSPNTRAPGEEVASVSLLEGMTLRARRICLIDSADGRVSKAYFQKGVHFVGYSAWRDPHTILAEKGSSIKPSLDKDPWRNVAMLFAANEHAPLVVRQSAKLLDPEQSVEVVVYGVVTRQAALDIWLRDTLVAPVRMLNRIWMMDELGGYIAAAETIGGALARAMRSIAMQTNIETSEVSGRVVQQYYASVRNRLFGAQLDALVRGEPQQIENLQTQWRSSIRIAALTAFAWGSERLGDSAKMLAAVAKAELGLHKALSTPDKKSKKEEA